MNLRAEPHRPGRGRWVAIACLVAGSLASSRSFAAGADYFSYQVPLGPSPIDGRDALATLDQRARAMLAAVACGSELGFAQQLGEAGEGLTGVITAKLEWAAGHPDGQGSRRVPLACRFSRVVGPWEVCPAFLGVEKCKDTKEMDQFVKGPIWKDLREGRFTALNEILKLPYGPSCQPNARGQLDGLIARTGAPNPGEPNDWALVIDFLIDRTCLLAQVSSALEAMKIVGQLGSDGVPCDGRGLFSEGGNKGDWDMTVRNLTRIVSLDQRYGSNLLTPAARTHVQNDLLSADGGPAEESYSLLGCGNTQESTGSSADRADERSWTDRWGRWLSDFGLFLLKLLLIAIVVLIVVAIVFFTLGAGAGIAAALVGVAAAGVTVIALNTKVPETENHLLMINTSKYLKNQFIIADVGAGSDRAARFETDQKSLRTWLLARMQRFLQDDFIEYNSRPYQRLSLVAILNIADFAQDDDLRFGAQLVLDYSFAKFAVGSQQGRRFVPFRRLRGVLKDQIAPTATGPNGLFDLVSGGDHQIAQGLLYAGQTQQLRGARASFGAAEAAIYAVTSRYVPEQLVIDLAIQKQTPVFQRIHHAGAEVYSSGRTFLISAGGIETGQAYSGSGIESLDQLFADKVKGDLGLALPTTLFLAAVPAEDAYRSDHTTLADLIRIEGHRPSDPDHPSYGHNLCVWDGFACGTNIAIPNDLSGGPCMTEGPSGTANEWRFIDSKSCAGYARPDRFFIALYRQSCPTMGGIDCDDNFGFFEIVDASPGDSFDLFKTKVLQANPPGFVAPFLSGLRLHGMGGTYHSARGQAITFSADAHQQDDTKTGILQIDGVKQEDPDDWDFAGGDGKIRGGVATPMTAKRDGLVTVRNARLGRVELDFRDVDHPTRRVY